MKKSILTLLILSTVLVLSAQAEPAATPEALAQRYAQALLTANRNLAESCLLPLDAYRPMAVDPDGKATPELIQQHHAKYVRKRLSDVVGFKKEAADLGLDPETITKISVQVKPPKKNHRDPQALFWFHSGDDRWKCGIEGSETVRGNQEREINRTSHHTD